MKEWEEQLKKYGEMMKAAGVKKPSESQKAKAFWAVEGSQRQEKNSMDPART